MAFSYIVSFMFTFPNLLTPPSLFFREEGEWERLTGNEIHDCHYFTCWLEACQENANLTAQHLIRNFHLKSLSTYF